MACNMASAHDIAVANSDGKTIYYNYNSDGSSLTVTYQGESYDSYSDEYIGEIAIPESVNYSGNTYSVTSIGEKAFGDCSGLTSVTIPESVTSIDKYAFSDCYGLTSVTWNAVNYPDFSSSSYNPFYNIHTQITNFNIGESVTKIPAYLCYGMKSLTSVTIPEGVTVIGDYAFSGGCGLTSVTIPSSVTSIGSSAFNSNLKSIVVNKNNMKYDSRKNCNALIETKTNMLIRGCQNTIIPNGVRSIGSSAFSSCSGLTSITIPESVTSIGRYSFRNCSGLTSITIPKSVKSIDYDAFYGCSGLKKVIVKDIGAWCRIIFQNEMSNPFFCADQLYSDETTEIKHLVIPDTVTSIRRYAFRGCNGFTFVTIGNSVTSIGREAFLGCSGLTSVTIPNSVTSIDSKAFSSCDGLKFVNNGNSVTSVAEDAFIGTPWYRNQKNVVYIGKVLYLYNGSESKVEIRNGTTRINNGIFSGHSELVTVSFPESLREIGSSAFKGCSGLTSVTIPNSVTSIGKETFSGCSGLTSVTIPNSVTSIGEKAFGICNGLISVTIGKGVNFISSSAFYGCSGLTSVTWNAVNYPDFSSSSYNPFYNIRTQITNFNIGESVTKIPAYLCYGMKSLTSVTIPEGVTSIDKYAFSGCSGLTSVTIPESVTSIGSFAFDDTAWYNKQPKGLLYINNILYQYKGTMPANTSVTIREGTISISDWAFYGCSGLTSVTIPNSVTSIGSSAFSGCSGLTSVTIGNSVTSIGSYAFRGCSGLTSITCLATTPPGCPDNNFNEVNKGDCLLYVPSKSVTAYKNADVWKNFNIVGIKPIYNKGDANGDSQIDVADFTAIANFILGSIPENFEEDAADVNKDEIVNVADITGVANIILYGSLNSSAAAKGIGGMEYRIPVMQAKDFAISAGGEYVMDIDIENPDMQFSACQFDVHLPKGISIKSVTLGKDRTTSKKTNYLDFATLADGTTRVICASTKDVAFAGTEGTVARLTVVADDNVEAGSYDVTIDNIVLSKAGDMAKPESVTINADIISATGISEIKTAEPNSADGMYDILGRRISNSEKLRDGIYIIGGKKVIK
ncbi:MAG: leucine-rich repeat protein [Prevotella sp.]|nr:leucine-rich repeat protein [Prevotella sp.]